MMRAVSDRDKIREFFELSDQRFNLRKYSKPVLVYEVADDKVRYSLWEKEILDRFGLENVDGWDNTENLIFCPDWMQDEEEEEFDDDIDDDDLDDKFNWNFGSDDENDIEDVPEDQIFEPDFDK